MERRQADRIERMPGGCAERTHELGERDAAEHRCSDIAQRCRSAIVVRAFLLQESVHQVGAELDTDAQGHY